MLNFLTNMRHLSAQFTTTRNKLENTHTSARNSFKENAQETKKNSYPYNCISFEKLVSLKYMRAFCSFFILLVPKKFSTHFFTPPLPPPPIINFGKCIVGFRSIGYWCYSGWWVWDLKTLAQFKGSEMSPELFQDFICMSIKKLKDTLM